MLQMWRFGSENRLLKVTSLARLINRIVVIFLHTTLQNTVLICGGSFIFDCRYFLRLAHDSSV